MQPPSSLSYSYPPPPFSLSPLDTLDDDDEVLWALAEQLGDKDFVVFVGGPEHSHTLLVRGLHEFGLIVIIMQVAFHPDFLFLSVIVVTNYTTQINMFNVAVFVTVPLL